MLYLSSPEHIAILWLEERSKAWLSKCKQIRTWDRQYGGSVSPENLETVGALVALRDATRVLLRHAVEAPGALGPEGKDLPWEGSESEDTHG